MDKQYFKNDFYYYTYKTTNPVDCTNFKPVSTDTYKSYNNCRQNRYDLKSALCDNKRLADHIIDSTLYHSGSDRRYSDISDFTDTSFMNILNLGIGILASAIFIAKTYK